MSIYDPTTIRQQCVEQHNALLEQAIATLTAKGCTVHPVKDAAEAAAVIRELCTAEQKTMCTFAPELEEIQLSQALPAVIPTDMEAVVAASLNRPFVNPRRAPLDGATQDDIVKALQQWLGEDAPVNTLMASISHKLKSDADKCAWGITGADGIAADTGTLILAEDQGNGRIVSNIPTCHIAVVGLEKIYPSNESTLETVHETWKAGGRQDAPVYYSYITGPSRTGDIEGMMVNGMHGPQQVHVILLDNGRSTLLDQGKGNVLKCIECGRCTAGLQQLTDGQAAPAPLTCKSLALANLQTPIAITEDAWSALTFDCPVGITADDLKLALK